MRMVFDTVLVAAFIEKWRKRMGIEEKRLVSFLQENQRKSTKSRDRNCPQTVPKLSPGAKCPEPLVYQGKGHKS